MTLTKGAAKFHRMLTKLKVGDVIAATWIQKATGWVEASLSTYVHKNKLARFLRQLPNGDFEVLRAGPRIAEQEVERALTQVNPESVALAKGDELGGDSGETYTLTIELGRGAVGHVWEAVNSKRRVVAVKIVNPRPDLVEPTQFKNVAARFRREAKNGRKLSHRNVVGHVDHGEFGGTPFLVMEKADRSWGDVLKTEGPVARARVVDIIRDALAGLAYLHGKGCVHRDVKPDNLLLLAGRTVVGDLGIVRWSELNPEFTSAGTITRASTQLGSWFYMAPEQQIAPHDATAESDVYALGVTWYELLTGDHRSPTAFAARDVPPPPTWPESVDWILRMTAYAPSQRPALREVVNAAKKW